MTNTDLKSLSKADLMTLVQEARQKEAALKALNGVKIEYAEGINKQDKPWQNIGISGGIFGWPGIKLTPAKWDHIKTLTPHIDAEVDNVRHKFPKS